MVASFIRIENAEWKVGLGIFNLRHLWRCLAYDMLSRDENWLSYLCQIHRFLNTKGTVMLANMVPKKNVWVNGKVMILSKSVLWEEKAMNRCFLRWLKRNSHRGRIKTSSLGEQKPRKMFQKSNVFTLEKKKKVKLWLIWWC